MKKRKLFEQYGYYIPEGCSRGFFYKTRYGKFVEHMEIWWPMWLTGVLIVLIVIGSLTGFIK